jgi:succinoglycan biosynthesis transport protein ExoP
MTPITLLRMIWARRLVILATIIVFVLLGALAGKMMPKVYEAKTRVLLDTLSPDQVTGQPMPAGNAKAYIQAQSEIIRDSRVAGAVVDHFGWAKMPAFIAAYNAQGAGTEGGIRAWLAQQVVDSSYVWQNNVTSNILDISYRSSSAESARKIADALRDAYIEQSLAFKRDNAMNNSRWHRQQAEKLKKQLAAAETRKSEFEQRNGILLQDDNVDAETAKLRAMTSSAAIPPPIMPVAAVPIAPSAMAGQVALLDSQIAAAQQQLGPNHPQILAMQRQRVAMAAAAAREEVAARAAAAASRQMPIGPSISSLIDSQTRKVLAQRGLVGEAQRLAGDVAVLRDQLAKTAAKAADFELQAQSTEIGLEPLGNAVAPEAPITPYFSLFLTGGIGLGLAVGLLIALALEFAFRRVRGVEDLESFDGLPVLGVLPPRRRPGRGFKLRFPFGRGREEASAT